MHSIIECDLATNHAILRGNSVDGLAFPEPGETQGPRMRNAFKSKDALSRQELSESACGQPKPPTMPPFRDEHILVSPPPLSTALP